MTPSIRGGYLPDSEADFEQLRIAREAPFLSCYLCAKPFSALTVKTPEGWRETQISGMCEVCYDDLFREEAGESGVDTL